VEEREGGRERGLIIGWSVGIIFLHLTVFKSEILLCSSSFFSYASPPLPFSKQTGHEGLPHSECDEGR